MAQELDDGKFWLPADFLDDDEEDYLNELSRNLAHSTLEDDFSMTETNFTFKKSTTVTVGSPKSTLSCCNQISSRGSSNCPSPVPRPPLSENESPWNVLCAAAGEVARMRLTGEVGLTYHDGRRNHKSPPPPPLRIPSPNPQFHQVQDAKMIKQQQFVQQNRVRYGGGDIKLVAPSLSAWPTLQQAQQQLHQPQGKRVVFLGNINTKRECAGTGVFLPRQFGAPTEPHKKQGEMRYRDSVLITGQRRQQAEKGFSLPQEWTY